MNVEDMMRQVRARVADRRGDPTEQDVQRLASAKLDALVAAHEVGGDGKEMLFGSGSGLVRFLRRILRPILGLFINTDNLAASATRGDTFAQLVKQLVTENARLQLEVSRLKMRVESLSTRFDFEERRAKVMGPRPPRPAQPQQQQQSEATASRQANLDAEPGMPPRSRAGEEQEEAPGGEASAQQRMRRRRRRRGRRPSTGGAGPSGREFGGGAEQSGSSNAPAEQSQSTDAGQPHRESQPPAERQQVEQAPPSPRNDVTES